MGGSNFGRSHEPQQSGGAHVSNTLSSPNAALAGGIGGPPEHPIPDDPPPQKASIERYTSASHHSKTGAAPKHSKAAPIASGGPRGQSPPGAAGRVAKRPRKKKTRQGTPKGYPNLVFSLKIEV